MSTELEEINTTILSAVVRASIKVRSDNNEMCSETCPFHDMQASQTSVLRSCRVFHRELEESFRGFNGEIWPRTRDQACLDMFNVVTAHTGNNDKEMLEATSKLARTVMDGMAPKKVEHVSVSTSAPEDSDDDEFELINNNEASVMTEAVVAEEIDDDNDDVSDVALGLDDDPYKPLDANDPVIKDRAWKRYQDEAPVPYAIVAVYGIHFTPTDSSAERMLYKKVQVFPCSDAEREVLNIKREFGFGKVIGTNETIEIHRWKKTKAYIKQWGK